MTANKTSVFLNQKVKAIIFFTLGVLFFGYEFFLRASPNVMQAELQAYFSLDATMLGVLSSSYYYGYALFQIPSGLLIDRFGSRLFLAIGAALCGGGAIMLASTDLFLVAWAGRFLIGAGSAFALIGTLKLAAEWFSADRYGFLAGLTLMVGVLGALLSSAPLAWGVSHFGWQATIIYAGVLGLLLAGAIYIIVRDKKTALAVDKKGRGTALKEALMVIKNPQSWVVGIFGGALYVPINVLAELWGTPFLMHRCGCTSGQAAAAFAAIFLGVAVGGPLAGWISDRLKRRKLVALSSTFIALFLALVVVFVPVCSLPVFSALVFVFGLVLGSQVLMFPIVRELNPSHVSAFTAGFCNTIAMGLTSAFQPLVGWILDTSSARQVCEKSGGYSVESLRNGLLVIPVVLLIAAFLLCFVRETYAKPLEEQKGRKK